MRMMNKRSIGLAGVTNLSVLAPIKPGLVEGFEPISYLDRLGKVLKALQSARQNVRESELKPPIFPDAIGQFGIIHHFRYAIVPPEPGAEEQPLDGIWRLSLNVTFDGGWEPYMRVIYRDIGTLLDLLFCHSPKYPGSRTSSFDAYCKWVRDNEIFGGIFYADSAMMLGDHDYLGRVEKAQREESATDCDFARLALRSAVKRDEAAMAQARTNPDALVLPLRTLKGLYRLSTYFPANGTAGNPEGDKGILRRFAQSVLRQPIALMKSLDQAPSPPPDWVHVKMAFADELAWLDYPHAGTPNAVIPQPCDPAKLQSHILGSRENMTHGCVVMLRMTDSNDARAYLQELAKKCGLKHVPGSNDTGYLVAFTYGGLKRLGISPERLKKLPQEFAEGMEARCGLLGDLRSNHPDRWARPVAYNQEVSGQRVDMKTVEVLIHLRREDASNTTHGLHSDFDAIVRGMDRPATTGLRVLAVQPTRSYRNNGLTAGHFDFADGISQPHLLPTPAGMSQPAQRDIVIAGELLLGHPNARGDQPQGPVDPLLMDGSFLVVRKLRQHVDRLDCIVPSYTTEQRKELLEKMMGRQPDGTPLVLPAGPADANDFDYAQSAASDACPFQSHIRRANPRDGRPYTPRILRRGMSYGPKDDTDRTTERGLIFMAYCASIAEQFETIQRWVTGGNSSGVGSAQADPFLRVPQAGENSTFRYLDSNGRVARAVFDDQPLVQLEWGLYLFVPALAALEDLEGLLAPPSDNVPRSHATPAQTEEDKELERVRQILEDSGSDTAKAAWQRVRNGDAAGLEAYGTLLGTAAEVLRAMSDKKGDEYSVQGYRERMELSGGPNLLGMDPGAEHTAQAPVRAALQAIDEKTAFDLTLALVRQVLVRFPSLPPGDPVRRPIDLLNFCDGVLAALCREWVGLPFRIPELAFMVPGGRLDDNPDQARCPGNMVTVSRYIFPPHPRADVQRAGQEQGKAMRKAVEDWLTTTQQQRLGTLAQDIRDRLGGTVPNESLALILAGVMQGFTPTVQGNFFRTMENWIEDETLWAHQQTLFESSRGPTLSYEEANDALRGPLFATMRQRPVPDMLWRSPVTEKVLETGKTERVVHTDRQHRIVLGITSALTDAAAPDVLMFGRDSEIDAQNTTVHGCPGYQMGTGVLLGLIGGLLKAGTLRPTGSPALLILTPNTPVPSN